MLGLRSALASDFWKISSCVLLRSFALNALHASRQSSTPGQMEKVDDFLLDILRQHFALDAAASSNSTAAGNFLLKSEENVISFLNTPDRMELEFPPLNSYYRRILHRLSRRYNLAHRVEVTNIFNSASTLRKVYLTKPVGTDLVSAAPLLKCCEWIEEAVAYSGDIKLAGGAIEEDEGQRLKTKAATLSDSKTKTKSPIESALEKPKFKILKRQSTEEKGGPLAVASSSSEGQSPGCSALALSAGGLSLEEREAKYQSVRDRIFEGFTGLPAESTESQPTVAPAAQSVEPVAQSAELVQTSRPVPLSTQSPSQVLNPDAIPFDFTPTASPTPTSTVNHIYLLTSSSAASLSHSVLTKVLSKFPSGCAVIKSRALPTDFCFLLVKDCEQEITSSGANCEIQKWVPEFYLD